jgi:3-(3-hydroxy-phenyl)propionate hydroxylase
VVVLDDNNTVSIGSRAVCYAKRPLEIWDRLGVGEGLLAKAYAGRSARCSSATSWSTSFDLLPEPATRCRR